MAGCRLVLDWPMPQSRSVVYLHAVFSTVDRRPWLVDPEVRRDLVAFMFEASRRLDCPARAIGVVTDHVHLLVRQGRSANQSDWIKEIKRSSTIWLRRRAPNLVDFHWQAGFGVFSVSASALDTVHHYVATQEERHRCTPFQPEFRRLLEQHGEDTNDPYLWK